MGIKSKSKATNQTRQANISTTVQVEGLLFDSEDDFWLFKGIDENLEEIIKSVEEGEIEAKDYFNRFKTINVKETYHGAEVELDKLFKNVTRLLSYDDIEKFEAEFSVCLNFYKKINIIEYGD